jgi:integrase
MKEAAPSPSHTRDAAMSWSDKFVTLPSGKRVRYSFILREDSEFYYVRYVDIDGRKVKRSSGESVKHRAIDAAHRMILEAYQCIAPTSETVTWEVAKAKLKEAMEADGKRPRTVGGYLETLDKLIAMFPLAKGPADVTDRMANDFKVRYGAGRKSSSRKHAGEGAATPPRRAKSLDSRVRTLKAVFGWLKEMKLVDENAFEKVSAPTLDRREVKYVRQADVGAFFEWLEERFPGWGMPRLFFSVKALSGCRLQDVCGLRSHQLQDRRIVFEADLTKNRSERYVVLPEALYGELDAYKGETYLWERYPAELKAANRKNGAPAHRQGEEFSPRRLYLWVAQLMGKYQAATGRKLSSHDFRRAAFTRAAEKGVHPARAAAAFDVTSETMLRYYTATEKKKTADEVLGGLADDLLPPPRRPGEGAGG